MGSRAVSTTLYLALRGPAEGAASAVSAFPRTTAVYRDGVTVVGDYSTPVGTTPGAAIRVDGAAARFVRWGLLAVLLIAGILLLLTQPAHSDRQTLLHDAQAGRITQVVRFESAGGQGTLRWSTGAFSWWEAPLPRGTEARLLATVDRLQPDAGALRSDLLSSDGAWPQELPQRRLAFTAGFAWLVTLLLMLTNRYTVWANRWAWLWGFVLAGVLAMPLYLWLEPQPLWSRQLRWPRHVGRRVTGGRGVVMALLVAFVLAFALNIVPELRGTRLFSGAVIPLDRV
jgi:hypothetical protein